jgi:hypothetical protein
MLLYLCIKLSIVEARSNKYIFFAFSHLSFTPYLLYFLLSTYFQFHPYSSLLFSSFPHLPFTLNLLHSLLFFSSATVHPFNNMSSPTSPITLLGYPQEFIDAILCEIRLSLSSLAAVARFCRKFIPQQRPYFTTML